MPDPKTIHAQICDDHQKAAESYFEVRTTGYVAFQNLVESDEEARKTLIDTGALAVDKTGNIEAGWYKCGEGYEGQTVQGAGNSAVWTGGVQPQYFEVRTTGYVAFQNLVESDEEARKTLIDTGALAVDKTGNIEAGWYKCGEGYEGQTVQGAGNSAVWTGGGATAAIGAIGVPAAAWTAVAAFGTASTGAAIGALSVLSGAAATSATAAWFGGGAVAAGGLGVAAAPFVLSGIGIVAGVGILGVAALVSHTRNSRKEQDMVGANKVMKEAMKRMNANGSVLKELSDSANQVSKRLVRATGVLLVNKGREAVESIGDALFEAGQLYPKLQQPLPYSRLYVGKPSPVESVTSITTTSTSVTIHWKDPDEGNSEIDHYRILYSEGNWGGDKSLGTLAYEPTFTHSELKPGTKYTYKIIPVNKIGQGDVVKSFDARTQSV